MTTRHTLKIGRRTLRYTATAGRIVLREEVFEDGVFKGHKAKAELGVTSYVVDAPKGSQPPGHLRLQRRPGLQLGLAAPRPARAAPRRLRRRRQPHAAALRPARQHRDPAGGVRPRLHRPRVDRLLARRRGRQAQGLPRVQGRHRERRRAHPAVDHAPQPLAVTEVHRRRVLRHDPRRRPRRAPAEPATASTSTASC